MTSERLKAQRDRKEARHARANKRPRRDGHKPRLEPKPEVAYCVFCKREHEGGATCMGHYP